MQLEIKNLGPVPSFKNRKRIAAGRLVTDPEAAHWMEQCIQSFVSQFFFMCPQEDADETRTIRLRRSWIASVAPLDDSLEWIPELMISCNFVPEKYQGATITITELK